MTTASARSSTISFQVVVNLSAEPDIRMRTPSGRPLLRSGSITCSWILSIAAWSGMSRAGDTDIVTVRTRSMRRIWVGPLVHPDVGEAAHGQNAPVRGDHRQNPDGLGRFVGLNRPLERQVDTFSVDVDLGDTHPVVEGVDRLTEIAAPKGRYRRA